MTDAASPAPTGLKDRLEEVRASVAGTEAGGRLAETLRDVMLRLLTLLMAMLADFRAGTLASPAPVGGARNMGRPRPPVSRGARLWRGAEQRVGGGDGAVAPPPPLPSPVEGEGEVSGADTDVAALSHDADQAAGEEGDPALYRVGTPRAWPAPARDRRLHPG